MLVTRLIKGMIFVFCLMLLCGCAVRTHAKLVLIDGFVQHDGRDHPFTHLSKNTMRSLYPNLDYKKRDTLVVADTNGPTFIFCASCTFNFVIAMNVRESINITAGGEGFELVRVEQPYDLPPKQEKLSKASATMYLRRDAADGVFGVAFKIKAPTAGASMNFDKTFRLTIPGTVDGSAYIVHLKYKFEKKHTLKESIGVPGM